MSVINDWKSLHDAACSVVGGFDSKGSQQVAPSLGELAQSVRCLESAVDRSSNQLYKQEAEPAARLFTNIQSGDVEASTDYEAYESELWNRKPLYL